MSLAAGNHGSAASGSASSLATSAFTTTIGSGVVVGYSTQGTFVSLTDSYGNPPPIQIGAELGASQKVRLYYYPRLTAGGAGHTFTCTISAANFLTIFAQEVTSSNQSGLLLDQQNGGDDAATPFGDALGITTTRTDEMLVSIGYWAAGGLTNPDTWTAGNSFTMTENQTAVATVLSGACGVRAVQAPAAYTASWTATQATTARMHLAAFSEAPVVSAPTLWAGGFI